MNEVLVELNKTEMDSVFGGNQVEWRIIKGIWVKAPIQKTLT